MRIAPSTPFTVAIDKLTNSIENVTTGKVFDTEVTRLTAADSTQIKKKNWQFDWKKELSNDTKETYKLTTAHNPAVIQGLLSIEDKGDHVFMHLLKSTMFNKGRAKIYVGVPGNLVAFACKVSFERGYEGFLSFISKTALKQHYQYMLGAKVLHGDTMIIETADALKLVVRYFKS